MRPECIALPRFLMGPLAIYITLKLVSGTQHIHVFAPATCLVAWFIIWLVYESVVAERRRR